MKMLLAAGLLVICSAHAPAQTVNPQGVLEELIRQGGRPNPNREHRQRNEALRLELERLDLEEQLRYRRATNMQIVGELGRYCPGLLAPCAMEPPHALVQEAARRGLVRYRANPSPGTDCVTLGDGEGGGITTCD